ncbi:TPA: Asp-tRNA(Asn)/Glu-tRNA(Gln) amidotransferase GatCAB subunit C [Candidatus Dependentiae bacterium]|nr:MAG: Aspartyl/glutamyl-tRNA(Asn/Gln) amidotransferase subunit C [candidate division TM6 bacterium GW2011_GWF2_36_131]KKQ03338.1 MAG: Aspartyl/glutamyl-tRNA(Asn/Gln) amidotransferase subunit C [candidate division TM6 bacterium GW2011_GWE2_36_25]KKQ19734.1 MAG: Aspartyl/glutamyl-tRNA(Asn/Gln) amidotransferase subunit C [candidate division TM6 bacterium GW2011_GWA2_36_9]HBR70884.1 Asp-tRNA(Asn)/Glu-tRNA(Gln) amidotransferase GatCAB subunit C [Candidatus Dependentiae bacterium]HCU00513.1 Asp-tRN
MKITRDELLRIADISKLEIRECEIEPLVSQLQAVLSYAERVNQVAEDIATNSSDKNINIMREDSACYCVSTPILAQAPEREEDYFVVPKIL